MNIQESVQILNNSVKIPEKVKEYFTQHSLNSSFLKNDLGWKWNDNTIIIPIYDQQGKEIYCKYRHLDFSKDQQTDISKFTFDKGSHPTLYCLHKIKKLDKVVLVEGEIDSAQLWQNNIPSITSTGGVSKFDSVMANMLIGHEVIVCLDTDKAGQKNIWKIVQTLTKVGIKTKILELPVIVKDVCEFFASGGTCERYKEFIKQAKTPSEWWKLHKPEDFATITAGELLTLEFPSNPWLINHVLAKEGFAFFIAAEGSYKSFITLDMALAIVSGKNWLGLDEFKVEHSGKVLFIDKENPLEMVQRRIKGLGYSGKALENIYWVKYPEKLQLADDSGQISEFIKSLSAEVINENIDLVVIDSFVDLMVGNENSADDTQTFIKVIRESFPKKAILVLHHENKPSQGTYRNDAQRTRGSTNINAQAMTMFRLETVAGSKTEITIKQTKCRDAQKLDKFLIEAQVKTDQDGKTYVTGFNYKGIVEDLPENKVEEAKNIIEEIFKDSPFLSRQEIVDACNKQNVQLRSVERALKSLVKNGTIDSIPNPNNKRKKNFILINSNEEDKK